MRKFKYISREFRKIKKVLSRQIQKKYHWSIRKFENKPITSVIVILGAFFILIIIGNLLRTPEQEEKNQDIIVKNVEVFSMSDEAEFTVQGQIEKSGIITIIAQSPGIVNEINVKPGEEVKVGKKLVSLSSNYQGSSASSVQRQIAGTQYQNIKDTLSTQKEVITKQKELANEQNNNADKLREISENSIGRTEDLLNLNNNILHTINSNLENLEENNPAGINDDAILSTKQIKSQIQSTISQLESGLDNTRYQSNDDNPQAKISNLSKDITLKQLDLQEKALDLSLKTSGLQLQLAQIQESAMFPVSPINGVVDRVFVKKGQTVNPGTPLAIIHGDQKLQLISKIPFDMAQLIDNSKESTIYTKDKEIKLLPSHISIDATDGSLSTILFDIPDIHQNTFANNSYLSVSIPILKSTNSQPYIYIPIDAVHHLPDGALVYVADGNRARSLNIETGTVQGNFVAIKKDDLSEFKNIILTRNISNNDHINF